MRKVLKECTQGICLSKTPINGVLKRFRLNGYGREQKSWKFFRAKKPDELWQLDIKGPFWLHGRKYWFPVCVDDFSRYLLLLAVFEHEPTTDEITGLLGYLRWKPESILVNQGGQFKEQWKRWCMERRIEPLYAHSYYPQDKEKIERTIRNATSEITQLYRGRKRISGGF